MRFQNHLVMIATVAIAVASATRVEGADTCKGIWSAAAKQPHVGDAFTADAIAAPDKQSSLAISEEAIEFVSGSGAPVKLGVPVNTALMEIVWSPDSKAFGINVSDGSNLGPWRTYIFTLAGRDTPVPLPLDAEIENAIRALPRCDAKAPDNLATVAWLLESKELLIVAETPALDSCTNKKSELVGFKIAADSGKTIERIARASLVEKWPKEIGCRLQKE
jgi:hypothetical protein